MRNILHSCLTCAALLVGAFADHDIPQEPLVLQHALTNQTISPKLFIELEELARIVDISYCVGLTSLGIEKPFQCLSRCADFPAFELVRTWNTGILLSDSCGYIALDHEKKRLILAFRGTYSIPNTIVDLSTMPQEYVPYPGSDGDEEVQASDTNTHTTTIPQPKCHNCTVHRGFHSSWMHTRDVILQDVQTQIFLYPHYQLHLVGHSLGGAVAALAGLDFLARGWKPIVTTFGEPRIGNAATAAYLDDRFNLPHANTSHPPPAYPSGHRPWRNPTFIDPESLSYRRVTHIDDPVPLLPLTEWGFAMHAGEIYIRKPSLAPSIVDIIYCNGDADPLCLAAQDGSLPDKSASMSHDNEDTSSAASIPATERTLPPHHKRDLLASVLHEIEEIRVEPWGIPSRYKLWQLFFAHRDYFWRLGLCVPGGDPLGGGARDKYEHLRPVPDSNSPKDSL